jgi:NAD(P)-dependent dehydrogenase (short-subunit alcohol dehydrogenase family)
MQFEGKTVVVASISLDRGSRRTCDRAQYDLHMGVICARDFARHGAHVVILDSDQDALDALAATIRGDGGAVTAIRADPGDFSQLEQAAAQCARERGAVHVLLTCHSDIELESIEDSSVESWSRVINFDLLGPVFACKAFLPLLKLASGAAIVHFGSIDGTLGNPQVPAYSAAKGGLVPLTHVMADEFARYGIRVNCLARAMTKEKDAPINPMHVAFLEHTPLKRPAYPEEVAAAARFLASSGASYITGVVLPVDGGRACITPGTRLKP